MRMVLVRHGHAGTKEGWKDDDRLRPLDARGRRQAARLPAVLVPLRPGALFSSPLVRCVQTLEPTAAATGLAVQEHDALVPDDVPGALDLVHALACTDPAGPPVLCTHGEVLGEVLASLAAEASVRLGRRAPGVKGCAWVVDFRKGRMASARYVAPGR
ncbi:MAG TPA: phosphoglycerate mutase family protein [Acidimicrobiales bacterium]|nr:phosphoglycerate mutase family protein [Acidimicrobiales bacterium]